MRFLSIVLLAIVLQGCSAFGDKFRIANETQVIKVPLLVCPAPPNWQRPITLIEDQDLARKSDGELVKAYVATIKELQGYVVELETIVKSYDDTSKAYTDVRKRFEAEWVKEQSKTDTAP